MVKEQLQSEGILQDLCAKAWLEFQQHPIAALSSLVIIVTGLAAFTKTGRSWVKRIVGWLAEKARPTVPSQTLRVVPSSFKRWWHMGKTNDKPAMQVVTSLYVTNVTDKPVHILSTIIKPTNTLGNVHVRHPQNNVYGEYPVLPGATSIADVHYWIQPPIKKEGADLKATVFLVDQYGNKHKVKNILFVSDEKLRKKEEPTVPEENVHSLIDPIEKEVVSVLKDEVNRYKACGRRVGGLGSIHTVLEGKTYTGIPPDSRKTDWHQQQDIFTKPNEVMIESDNFHAMMRIFELSKSEEEKTKLAKVLLYRLSKDTEYAPIGYFICLVLFKQGFFSGALRVAKEKLQGDSKYGFSDLLRIIDGLLRFKHPDFSQHDLDEIERFLDGITEHTFRIKQRITAIRSYRLATE